MEINWNNWEYLLNISRDKRGESGPSPIYPSLHHPSIIDPSIHQYKNSGAAKGLSQRVIRKSKNVSWKKMQKWKRLKGDTGGETCRDFPPWGDKRYGTKTQYYWQVLTFLYISILLNLVPMRDISVKIRYCRQIKSFSNRFCERTEAF